MVYNATKGYKSQVQKMHSGKLSVEPQKLIYDEITKRMLLWKKCIYLNIYPSKF